VNIAAINQEMFILLHSSPPIIWCYKKSESHK